MYGDSDDSIGTLDDMLSLMREDGGSETTGSSIGANEYYHVSVALIKKLKAHISKTKERERLQVEMHEAVLEEVEELRGIVKEHQDDKRKVDQLWGELKVSSTRFHTNFCLI